MKFTFCISTHNNLEYLKIALNSILENSYYSEFPILVYAEGCNDGTNEYLKSLDIDNLTYYIKEERWKEEYWGIGGGLNFCADHAETEYLLFTHSDMYHTKDWDKPLFDRIKELGRQHLISPYRTEPKIFEFGQKTKYGTVVVPKESFGEYHHNFKKSTFDNFAYIFTKENDNVDIPLAQGVNFIIHKDDWIPCDPIFAPASFDDVDLFLRMKGKGYKFHTIGSSMIYHFGARGSHYPEDDLQHSSKRQKEAEDKNKKLFVKKWGKMFSYDRWGMFTLD